MKLLNYWKVKRVYNGINIIINDINVSNCSELGETIDGYTCGIPQKIRMGNEYIYKCKLCKDNPFCLFKELKRAEDKIRILEKENIEYKRYKYLFEKAKEFKEKSDKYAEKTRAENEDLKDSLRRTVCQAECFRYKESKKYKEVLEEIKEITSGDYELLDPQALQEIRQIISEVLKDE